MAYPRYAKWGALVLFLIATLFLHQEGIAGALASFLALVLFAVLYTLDEVSLIREADLRRLRQEEEKRIAEEKPQKEPKKGQEEVPSSSEPPRSRQPDTVDFKTVIYDRAAEERKLLEAVRSGNLTTVVTLVEQGVSVDAENQNGVTALMFATKFQHAAIVSYLIEQGADVNKKAKNGLTAMRIARELKNQEIIDLLSSGGALD